MAELKGFSRLTGGIKKRLILRVGGREKQGKTHFSLTAPAPIAFFDMDRGTEGVVDKFASDKEIYSVCYRSLPSATQDQHEAKWEKFKKDYYTALESPSIRSIVWDTDDEAWEMIRIARFGRLEKVPPMKYGPVNKEFRTMIDHAFDHDKNLILLSKMKKQYKEDKKTGMANWTGEWELGGFNSLPYLVQSNLRVFRSPDKEFCMEVANCRQNGEIMGEVLEGEMCSFPMLALYVLPDTALEDWE